MRYRIGEEPPVRDALHASDSMLTGTAIYGVILGIGFIVVGLRVKQRWLAFWGTGLSIASLATLIMT